MILRKANKLFFNERKHKQIVELAHENYYNKIKRSQIMVINYFTKKIINKKSINLVKKHD